MKTSVILFLLLVFFAATGWGWVALTRRKSGKLPAVLSGNPFWTGIVCGIFLFLVLAIGLSFTGHAFISIPLAAASAFLLPVFIDQTWRQYQSIPPRTYNAWYPDQVPVTVSQKKTGEIIDLTFKLPPPPGSDQPVMLHAALPTREYLGKAFSDCLFQYNKQRPESAIETTDDHQQPYGWEFYLLQLNGYHAKFLNPRELLWKQSFKPGAIVEVKQVNSRQPLSYRMKIKNP